MVRQLGVKRLVGIDQNFLQDIFFGILVGGLFIAISFFAPGISAIGFPSLSQSVLVSVGAIGLFFIVVIAAPILEEVIFRDFVIDFFNSKLKMPFIIAAVLSSVGFSFFHLTAYGGSLIAAGGSFISAFVVGIGFAYLRRSTNSILPSIIAHAIINAFILYSPRIVF